jgi:hypothetical protein
MCQWRAVENAAQQTSKLVKTVRADDVKILSDLHLSTFSNTFNAKNHDWNLAANFHTVAYSPGSRNDIDVSPP